MESKKTVVIAIAAVSGGGKSTITTHLNKKLHTSKALFFDDYEFDASDDIFSLLSNPVLSLDYILHDYPFAYKHSKMREYIDFTIFIDTPLDIAMARCILRDFKEISSDNIRKDLDIYLSCGRLAYLEALNSIKPNSDFIIDGSLSIDVIVSQIHKRISGISKKIQ